MCGSGALGLIVNPVSGNDVRRVTGRAGRATQEGKVEQVARCALGAVAAGVERLLAVRDPFRIAENALEHLRLDCRVEWLEVPARVDPSATRTAVEAMREAGAGGLAVFGGDGTSRQVATVWPDVLMVALAQGTNNAFPALCEPTAAGVALGLALSAPGDTERFARRSKVVRIRSQAPCCVGPGVASRVELCALIDAVLLAESRLGSSLPFSPEHLRQVVLSRAVPSAMGISALGGFLTPVNASEERGLSISCGAPDQQDARTVVVPVAPGAFEVFGVITHRSLQVDEPVQWFGPGVVACDGDRVLLLERGQSVDVWVERSGPRQLDVAGVLSAAAESGRLSELRLPRPAERSGLGCC